ncbi:MAG: hypothetical protein KTR24_05040 [Saprospiraceae bacterium]|nr:hypothetical protein [Saprospiraceae bacterium]
MHRHIRMVLPLLISLVYIHTAMAQDIPSANPSTLPYHEIPEAPDTYTEGTVVARTIDGLGYRYYWATKDLRDEDLDYKPSEDSRTARETLDHIYGLSLTIVNGPQAKPNIRPMDNSQLKWEEKRNLTLNNLWKASQMLRHSHDGDMEDYKIIFQRGDQSSEFAFWYMLNGPIADAIYHVGQIVAYRRASGNPLHPGVSVFSGKTRE